MLLMSQIAVGPQSYYVPSPSSYQLAGQQVRIPYGTSIGQQSPQIHSASMKAAQTLTTNSVVMNDDTPVTSRRFNSYKENKDFQNTAHSMLNASTGSIRVGDKTAAMPADFGQMLKQAVTEAVRSEKLGTTTTGPIDLKQVEDALLKEREERKQVKNQLKAEKKQVETLSEKLVQMEKQKSEVEAALKRSERETSNRGKELEILQNEISELRNEKILSEQLDEEHSAKMKVYTQDLMATSLKYQQDIQTLIAKNEKLVKEIEVLRAKCAELERQSAHNDQVQEALNRKLLAKENEIASIHANRGTTTSSTSSSSASKIKELESIIASQKNQLAEQEVRFKALLQAPRKEDDVFGILRSSKSLTPARRVSHLTSRREHTSYAPVGASDYAEWLEPLAIAEHVLSGATKA